MLVELTITATFEIPNSARPEYSRDGRCIGYTLKPDTDSAELITPWLVWEGSNSDGETYDLTDEDHLHVRGITEIDYTRSFELLEES